MAAGGDGRSSVTRVDGRSGASVSQPLARGRHTIVRVSDDGNVLVRIESQSAAPASTVVFNGSAAPTIEVVDAIAWSPASQAVAATGEPEDDRSCSTVHNTSRGRPLLQRQCDWHPVDFSPDGRWIYAIASYTDGPSTSSAAILDAATGEVARELGFVQSDVFAGGFIDQAWESQDALVLQVESAGKTALLRLDVVAGSAELTTPALDYAGVVSTGSPSPYALG